MTKHKRDSIQSPLAGARGLGPAHDGVHHWIMQRVTAAAILPLMLWLVWSMVQVHGWDYQAFTAWLAMPVNAVLMILSVAALFYHAALGMQVIFEDYVQGEFSKFLCIYGLNLVFIAGAVACMFCVLKIAL